MRVYHSSASGVPRFGTRLLSGAALLLLASFAGACFGRGPGDPDELKRLPEAALHFPGSYLDAEGTQPAGRGIARDEGASFGALLGTSAGASEVSHFYDEGLMTRGWIPGTVFEAARGGGLELDAKAWNRGDLRFRLSIMDKKALALNSALQSFNTVYGIKITVVKR